MSGVPKLSGVHETVLYAADIDATVRFYADVLGLVEMDRGGDGDGGGGGGVGRGLRLPSGGVLLIFDPVAAGKPGRSVPSHGAEGPGHIAFSISADSYAAWRAHLAAQGVEIEQEIEWPGPAGARARSIYFRDPAGNSAELMAGDYWEHVEAERDASAD